MSNYDTLDIQRLADIFKALSNSNRLRIFMRLVSRDGTGPVYLKDVGICKCVGELGKGLGIASSTVSHHIKELHGVGLIRMERRGQNVECWVDHETLDFMQGALTEPEPLPEICDGAS